MTTMVVERYQALKAAGDPEDKAQAAAKALAVPEHWFDRVDAERAKITAEIGKINADSVGTKVELASLKAELGMVKWIVSGVGFGVVLLVVKSFVPGL